MHEQKLSCNFKLKAWLCLNMLTHRSPRPEVKSLSYSQVNFGMFHPQEHFRSYECFTHFSAILGSVIEN